MEDFKDIIKIEYENLSKTLNGVLENNKEYEVAIVEDSDERILEVFNKNNKKILTTKYEILGSFNKKLNIYCWGCDSLVKNKELTNLSKEIKNYSKTLKKLIINKQFKDEEYMERLYYYLTNSMFYIENENLSDLIKISIYISNTKGVVIQENIDSFNNKINIIYLVTDIISY